MNTKPVLTATLTAVVLASEFHHVSEGRLEPHAHTDEVVELLRPVAGQVHLRQVTTAPLIVTMDEGFRSNIRKL